MCWLDWFVRYGTFYVAPASGAIAKRLCSGLQSRLGRFDSGSRLQDSKRKSPDLVGAFCFSAGWLLAYPYACCWERARARKGHTPPNYFFVGRGFSEENAFRAESEICFFP